MTRYISACLAAVAFLLVSCGPPAPRDPVPAMAPTEERDDSAALAKLNADLAAAVQSGDTDAIDAALKEGADVNHGGDGQESMLVIAIKANKPEVAGMLMDRGADLQAGVPMITLPEGDTVSGGNLLHVAAEAGSTQVIPLLVDKGLAVDMRDGQQNMPIHLAAGSGHADAIAILIDHGSPTDEQGQARLTPIMLAASNGHADAVKKLIEYGAGTNDRDREDRTALAIARANGHTEVVTVLEEAGASE